MTACIAIFTDDPGWHGKQLRRAFANKGYQSRFLSLKECSIDLDKGANGIVLPGFDNRLPDGAFIRGVPGGSLEQVILRLDFLHMLSLLGVPVYNTARAIEKSVDKTMTSLLLHHARIPTPPTWVMESDVQARVLLMREIASGNELVLKPLFGSQGTGLRRLTMPDQLPSSADYNDVYYFQRFIQGDRSTWEDYRVFVIGGVARAAMLRKGKSWINNVAQGAECKEISAAPELYELAERATRALDMDYAGIDLIRDRDGRFLVLEVNGIPAWKGLQSVYRQNIADILVEDFIARHMMNSRKENCA